MMKYKRYEHLNIMNYHCYCVVRIAQIMTVLNYIIQLSILSKAFFFSLARLNEQKRIE